MQWFIELQEVVAFFIPYLSGGFLAVVINWLKDKLVLKDRGALILTILLSVLVGIGGLVADNWLTPDALRIDNVAEIIIAVFLAATATYFKILRSNK